MVSKQYEWSLKKKAKGLCMICGKKSVTVNHCERHRLQCNAIKRKLYKRSKIKND